MSKKIRFSKEAARLMKLDRNNPGGDNFIIEDSPKKNIKVSKQVARQLHLDKHMVNGQTIFEIDNSEPEKPLYFDAETAKLLRLDGIKRPSVEPFPTIEQIRSFCDRNWEKDPAQNKKDLQNYLFETVESGLQNVKLSKGNDTVPLNSAEDIFSFVGFKNAECNDLAIKSVLKFLGKYFNEYSYDCINNFRTAKMFNPCPRETRKIFKILEKSPHFTQEDYNNVAKQYFECLRLRGLQTKHNKNAGLNYQDATILTDIAKNFAKAGQNMDTIQKLITTTPFKKVPAEKTEQMQKAEFDKQVAITQQIINNPELAKTSNLQNAFTSIKNRFF